MAVVQQAGDRILGRAARSWLELGAAHRDHAALRERLQELALGQRPLAHTRLPDQQVVAALPDTGGDLLPGPQHRCHQILVRTDSCLGTDPPQAGWPAQVLGVVPAGGGRDVRALAPDRFCQLGGPARARRAAGEHAADPFP